jgi:hypothetical protein
MATLEHAVHAPLSSLHSAPSPSATENANDASVEVVLSSGCDEIVGARGAGLDVIVQVNRLTLLRRPALPLARSRKTCWPSSRPRYVRGPTHNRQRASSSRHSGLAFGFSSHANVAFLETHGRTGTVVKVGRSLMPFAATFLRGATIVHEYAVAKLAAPAGLRARTRNVCADRLSPRIVIGLEHAVYTASSTAHSYVSPGSRSNANVARVEMAGLIGALEMRGAAGAASAPNAPRPT